MLINIQSL